MRVCCACGHPKDEDEFHWRNKAKGLRQAHCKVCQKKRGAAHYEANKASYRSRASAWKAQIRQRFIDWVSTKACVDCGEDDPVVLHCDHVRGKKSMNIATLVRDGRSWDSIAKELKKCEVRCANCHMRRTAKQFGWFKAGHTKRAHRSTGRSPVLHSGG